MSRHHVCLVADPAQWGFLNGWIPAQNDQPKRADVTWVGLIQADSVIPAEDIRFLHNIDALPALPKQDAGEDAIEFAARLEAAKTEQRAWFSANGWESDADLVARHSRRCQILLGRMVEDGTFESVTEQGVPVPHPIRFSIAKLGPGATMANVVVALGLFPSLGQARKNGQSTPLVLGRQVITKKRIAIEIVP